jgi:hypothetical protein
MKIAFVVPDGVGVKNYIYSNVFKNLYDNNHEITIIHALGNDFEEIIHKEFPKVLFIPLQLVPESFFIRLFRESISFARLHFNAKKVSNPTILRNWKKFHKISFQKKILYKSAEFLGSILRLDYHLLLKFESNWFSWNKKSKVYKFWVQVLQGNKPDVMLLTHQRVPEAIPVLQAAKDLGVNTFVAVFSWDNMPKARLSARGNRYLVWSDFMKHEFQLYHPEIDSSQIEVVGSPQFEYYQNNNHKLSRETFAKLNNLNIHKKWICFSGDDRRTSPFDQNYLEDLCEQLIDLGKDKHIEILVRPAPADLSGRFDYLAEKYHFVKIAKLAWKEGGTNVRWTARIPLKEDITILTSTVLHCDAVVNVGSTMALDFFNLKKPAFYINYDTKQDPNWSVNTIYQFQHFSTMDGLDPIFWINKKEDWSFLIGSVTDTILSFKQDSEKWLSRVNQYEEKGGANNFIKVLLG